MKEVFSLREKTYTQIIEAISIHPPRHYMFSTVGIVAQDLAREALSNCEKLASMAKYREADFAKFHITAANLPNLFDAFIMGQEYNDLHLFHIEVGIDGMTFHATSADIDVDDDYKLIVPYYGTDGTIVINDHEGKEAYEIVWEGKWLDRFSETIDNVHANYELQDPAKREFRVMEQNPAPKAPLCSIN